MESALIFVNDDPTQFFSDKKLDDYVNEFTRSHYYKKGSMKIWTSQGVYSDSHNKRADGIKLVTYAKEQTCSLTEWSKRFSEFIHWLVEVKATSVLVAFYRKYDGNDSVKIKY